LHIALVSAGMALATTAYMIAPGRASADMREQFSGLNWAHRGLHNMEEGIPENSMAAFRAAKEQGFGIELDLQLTADGQVVVFHDSDLKRMCNADELIKELSYSQLQEYTLGSTQERIPLFKDVLDMLDGQVPILVELKPIGADRVKLCAKALKMMRGYKGVLCMESFDPRIVGWFRRHAPEILRGQLTMKPYKHETKECMKDRLCGFVLSHVFTNFLSRPHFIAHRLEKKTFCVRIAEKMGAMRFAWTSRQPGNEGFFDGIIFEGYVPEPRYE